MKHITIKILLAILLISLPFFILTTRGQVGNPTPKQIEFELNQSGKPFETSQERSRYALILSIVNYHSFSIDHYASMGTPDIGKIKGRYYSFFPPAASMLAIPLYLLGAQFNAAQIAVFSLSSIFSLLTMLMIGLFIRRLGLHWSISLFSAIAFGFATNAWGYSVTLYAHLISAFLITLGLYITSFVSIKHRSRSAWLIWTLYALAVFVDFPNLFIYLPIVGLAMLRAFDVSDSTDKFKIKISWLVILSPIVFFVLMSAYGYYNQIHFGSFMKLSNTIPRVQDLKDIAKAVPETGTDAAGALKTRNLLNGFKSFIFSHDRGIMIYSPIALLFIFGVGYFKNEKKWIEFGLLGVPLTCLVLYSMFGDPYGGWAFGSRYMIAILPALCILAGIGLQRFNRNILVKVIYTVVFIYSAAISLLAPLTTNVIPPFVEARFINLQSWFIINWKMLEKNQLDSFIYNSILNNNISGFTYYALILTPLILLGIFLIWYRKNDYENI